jgi:PST family polysaccharide transporter
MAIPEANPPALEPVPPADSSAPQNLGRRTISGLIWLTMQTVGSKLALTASRILLARLLWPSDFGVVAMALTISSFAGLIQQAGLNEILVQRGRHFARWANVAFWMSVGLGLLSASAMMTAAPLAARLYHTPKLVRLIAIAAVAAPMSSLSVVSMARLQLDLRFRSLAMIAFWANCGQAALSVIFAWLGFGPYSLLLPAPIVNLIQAALLWHNQARFLRLDVQWRRWKFMLADSGYIFASWIFYTIIAQGDYISLGLRRSREIVGIYFFGFNFSVQMNTLFTQNVMSALLPALSSLQHDLQRQFTAFLRAARGLALLGMPFGVLIVATAAPAFHVLFVPKWYPSIVVVQALGIGMSMSMIGCVSISLMQARGQFRLLMILSILASILFCALVIPAVFIGGAQSVAIAVGTFHFIYGPWMLYAGVRPAGGSWRDVAGIYGPPAISSILGIGAATALARLLPAWPGRDVLQIVLIGIVGLGLYGLIIRQIAPEAGAELLARLAVLRERLPWAERNAAAPATAPATAASNPLRPARVAVVQDGARLHYAVPLALHRAGALHVMYSEWFFKQTIFWRGIGTVVRASGNSNLRGILERRCDEIPASMVRINPLLLMRIRRGRRRFATVEAFYEWSSREVGKWVGRAGIGSANVLFGFIRNIDPALCRASRDRGVLTVGDQIIAPAAVEAAEFRRQLQRWPDWEPPSERPDFELVEHVERASWAALDRITCASEYVRRGLAAQGVSDDKISVIPYPIDASQHHYEPRDGRRGPLVVGFVGAVGLRKGAPYFLEIAKRLGNENLKFVMVGPVLLTETAARSMSRHVELAGRVARSQVADFLRRFDIFLFPSTCEGAAGAAMEAMALGLPVIASPNAGTSVRDGIDGLIRDYDDIDALAAAVQRLAGDAALRLQMGREARKRAETFHIDWYGRRLVEVMESALNS